jgi:hypothetical protein
MKFVCQNYISFFQNDLLEDRESDSQLVNYTHSYSIRYNQCCQLHQIKVRQ